ncbi:MAG TPA: ATP-binding protein [Phycisphaerae bacterium]|nr:ATP-binding protein [Phycisphaerae bacterium]HNU46234.1 ATP-binding protein [Phycisphaerae bacterium]
MAASFAAFERLKSKGVAAYQQGEYGAAKTYLVDAAECMLELAAQAQTPETRRQQEQLAAQLIDLAKDCDRQRSTPGKPRLRQREADEERTSDAAEWVVKEKPNVGFDDIAGLEDVKQEIRVKTIYPLAHPELAQRYGIARGGGVLLYGPPGTGKTMMAKAVAHEIDATFFLVSPAQLMSKWVGEAEQNVRKLFDAAKTEPMSVIFLDELEALVPKRKSDSSTVMQRVVPQILQELEGFDRSAERALLFVGATNKPWLLDEAMLRPGRLDAKVYIGLPDPVARYRLLEIHFGKRPLAEDVDFAELCDKLEGYSGADIKNIALEAAERPFLEAIGGKEARAITRQDVLEVIAANPPSVHPSDLVRYEKFAEEGR